MVKIADNDGLEGQAIVKFLEGCILDKRGEGICIVLPVKNPGGEEAIPQSAMQLFSFGRNVQKRGGVLKAKMIPTSHLKSVLAKRLKIGILF